MQGRGFMFKVPWSSILERSPSLWKPEHCQNWYFFLGLWSMFPEIKSICNYLCCLWRFSFIQVIVYPRFDLWEQLGLVRGSSAGTFRRILQKHHIPVCFQPSITHTETGTPEEQDTWYTGDTKHSLHKQMAQHRRATSSTACLHLKEDGSTWTGWFDGVSRKPSTASLSRGDAAGSSCDPADKRGSNPAIDGQVTTQILSLLMAHQGHNFQLWLQPWSSLLEPPRTQPSPAARRDHTYFRVVPQSDSNQHDWTPNPSLPKLIQK